jgi:hypothetical protein
VVVDRFLLEASERHGMHISNLGIHGKPRIQWEEKIKFYKGCA